MNFVQKPSLEHMILVKIAVSLWKQNDIRNLIKMLGYPIYSKGTFEEWKKIEERVTEKVAQLSLLPQLLKEKVVSFIKPIGLEHAEWVELHCFSLELFLNLPTELCWTAHGTVDRKKTAEMLVKDENLDLSKRYQLACIYCLEGDIQKFWNNISEDLKEKDWWYSPIVGFWSHTMKRRGLGNATYTAYRYVLDRCAESGNIEAAEYFLQKLTPSQRKEYFLETAKHVSGGDFLCFLISKMDEEQQMEVFKDRPYKVLCCFLHWPWQSFFIGIANRMWDFLPKKKCENILRDINHKVRDGYRDWNYQKLFREVWQKSPNALKSLITSEIDKSCVIPSLLRIKDKENVKLILKDATLSVKEKLMYSDKINNFCQFSTLHDEWDFLEFFIRECLPSRNDRLKFKDEFEKRPKFKKHIVENKQKWDKLFHFSDDSICEYDKRTVEEGECSSCKRIRSLK